MSDLEIVLEEISDLQSLISTRIYDAKTRGDISLLEKIIDAMNECLDRCLFD